VARGAAKPFAFDQALQPPQQGRARIAGQRPRGVDFHSRRQEQRGAHGRMARRPRLPLDMGSCLLRECRHWGLRMRDFDAG